MKLTGLVFFIALTWIPVPAQWIKQSVGTTASFRGLSVVNEKVVWASGTGGTVIKTTDAGKTWTVMTVPGAEKLDFRDIEAFDANTAYILSIGNGESSRIYKTIDGGLTWNLQFKNTNEKAFFDALACSGPSICFAVSDPVDGYFLTISTINGGGIWTTAKSQRAAKDGEAAFAASGTCLIAGPGGLFLVSGGSEARVFRPSGEVSDTPIVKGSPASGIFSIAMLDKKTGVIVGGNYEKPAETKGSLAFTSDGGQTWNLGSGLSGFRSAVEYVDKKTLIAVGTNGTDISSDGGTTWKKIGDENLNSVAAKGKNAVWSAGPNGNVFRLDTSPTPTKVVNAKPSGSPPNITRVDLSHAEIGAKCSSSGSKCSNKRQVTIRTTAIKWDGARRYIYTVTAGKVVGEGPNVEWDLTGVAPGKYTITVAINILYGDRWALVGKSVTKEVMVR